jgi:hypothetical protein
MNWNDLAKVIAGMKESERLNQVDIVLPNKQYLVVESVTIHGSFLAKTFETGNIYALKAMFDPTIPVS